MGNEVSRPADGVSPQGMVGGAASARGGSSFRLPTTPISTPSARRAKSFSSFQSASPPPPSSSSFGNGNGNGSTTPRARDAALQRQQSTPNVERTIQRMDKAIRKRVRGGITYNMKIIIRGEKGTGKTSLFHRLKGEPIPNEHETTPQLQSATINWNFRANSEENVKCEVWDVVDRGFNPLTEGSDGAAGTGGGGAEQNASPFELGSLQSNSNFASVRASAAVAASIAGASGTNGSHTVATVDASTVDVYHETHGAIFLLDVTKWHTLEYVRQQLEKVPVHIPTLVLGNFRDCGNQRKIFKEDIQDLLYGSSDRSRQQQQLRRPHELLYFECSLLNCYGLKSLHQYFGIPFLQLKLATIRQQMRIVEGEFSHLKNDLQAKISEQRYSDYVEHIKATGSDIRTGRKVPGASHPPAQPVEHTIVVNGSGGRSNSNGNMNGDAEERSGSAVSQERLGRTHSTASNGSDIVVVTEASERAAAPSATESAAITRASSISADVERQLAEPLQKDLDDLPERTNSLADQLTVPLKFEHSESMSSLKEEELSPLPVQAEEPRLEESSKASKKAAKSKASAEGKETKGSTAPVKTSPVKTARKPAAADEPVSLEDFQVPKQKNNDLDSFYSDEDSDANDESDEDVIVPPSAAMLKKYSHKQQFIYSDSSDSEEEMEKTRRKTKRSSSPRRRGVAKPTKSQDAVPEPPSTVSDASSEVIQHTTPGAKPSEAIRETVPSSPATAIAPTTVVGDEPASTSSKAELQPQPPSSPSATQSPPRSRPISPAARTSRSPSPRHKLETSRSSSPKAIAQHTHHASSTNGDGIDDGVEQKEEEAESETHEVEVEEIVVPENETPLIKSPESPSGQTSPRRRLHPIKSVQASQSPKSSGDEDERKETPDVSIEQENSAAGVVSDAGVTHKSEIEVDESEKSVDKFASAVPESNEETSTNAVADQSARVDVETFGDLEYSEDDKHVVLSDGMDNFSSDDEDESAVPSEAVVVQAEVETTTQSEASFESVKPIPKRLEMLMSDDEDEESEATQLPIVQSVSAPETNAKTQVTTDPEADFDVPVSKEDDTFFSDNDEEEVDEEKEEGKPTTPVSSPVKKAPVPPQNVSRVNRRPDMLMSDEEESEQEAIKIPVTNKPVRPNRRQDMLMSDDDSDSSDRTTTRPSSQFSVTVSQSGTTTQASSIISSPVETRYVAPSPSNDLESFFSESDSDADGRAKLGNSRTAMVPSPPARAKTSKGPMRHAMVASDDDDEDDESVVDRFSSYNAKATRKSKAERKQEREEIRRMSASMSSSRMTIEDLTPVATTIAATANADVLAAIRLAQEEAMRMLPLSDDAKEGSAKQERRHKKKSSSSSSSSRSKHSEDAGASSSSRKKKSSGSSNSSRLSSSASSRSSRRRDADSGDERRESRRR